MKLRRVWLLVYLFGSLVFMAYLLIPAPAFPQPKTGFLKSTEPADLEDPLRQGYYHDFSRAEVLAYYQEGFDQPTFRPGLNFFSFRLNYPPEEAEFLIRDQTRSYYLEEIVHPFRESLFVNGFIPQKPEDELRVEGKLWGQKTTVRYVPSQPLVRVGIYSLALGALWLVLKEFFSSFKNFLIVLKQSKLWTFR